MRYTLLDLGIDEDADLIARAVVASGGYRGIAGAFPERVVEPKLGVAHGPRR